MDYVSLIGWGAAAILLLTLGRQVWKEWKEGNSRGLSKWLFFGQMAASLGFVVYSWLKQDWVFVTTNLLILATAIAGQVIFYINDKKRGSRRS
jgi:MtN3 and saliva related transmembrane protein